MDITLLSCVFRKQTATNTHAFTDLATGGLWNSRVARILESGHAPKQTHTHTELMRFLSEIGLNTQSTYQCMIQ